MSFNPNQIQQVVNALATFAGKTPPITQDIANTLVQDPTQPSPQYPPKMTIVWSEQSESSAARITMDGATRVVYETATTKASLGEWKWQEVPLPFSINATYALAALLEAGQTTATIEAKLLQLKASMVRIIDDPNTNETARAAALDALRAIGEPIVPHVVAGVDESPLSE